MNVKVARIYVNEGKHAHQKIFQQLHDEHKVMGVTVYRGITGFGKSGETHSSNLLDMSFDLPVVIEFFDEADKVANALESISELIDSGNVITFDANNF